MKQRVFLFFTVFFYFILIFLIEKTIFTLVHASIGGNVGLKDVLDVLYHGLPLDLSMSGYLTAIPALVLIASVWLKPESVARIFNIYFAFILSLVGIITIVDIVVYPHWGFHFDSTVFLYLKNPKETFGSASTLDMIIGVLGVAAFVALIYGGYVLFIRKQVIKLTTPKYTIKSAMVLFVLTGALFLPIRGGVTVSTMNIGKAYFSDNMFLNHAAINPQFNLLMSFFKSDNFGSQYQFYTKEEASQIFNELGKQPASDSIPQLLNTDKPNIILFLLESFSTGVALDSIVAPNMSQYAKEGILFDHFYANSFRTDRGLVSVLSGYPAHPTVAIMKYPQKTESLPAVPKSLKQAGYENLSFYYGGDADFANMRSYYVGACGISNIISDKDFPLDQRMTKWGAPDVFLLERVYSDLTTKEQKTPFFKAVLTLSSHEPFDVPTKKFGDPFKDAVHYTDSCLGGFIERMKATDTWKNTLVIFIADHGMQSYPQGANNNDPERFRIPMIWTGGAVKQPTVISTYGSQNDMAATLLSQLKIKHDEYKFSKDMLNPMGNKFAFYSYVNGFCMTDSTGTITYDNDKQSIIRQSGNPDMEKKAKAFFQMMYSDLGER